MSSKSKERWQIFGGLVMLAIIALSIFVSWWFLLGLLVLGAIVNIVEPSPANDAEQKLTQTSSFRAEFRYQQQGLFGATLLF